MQGSEEKPGTYLLEFILFILVQLNIIKFKFNSNLYIGIIPRVAESMINMLATFPQKVTIHISTTLCLSSPSLLSPLL